MANWVLLMAQHLTLEVTRSNPNGVGPSEVRLILMTPMGLEWLTRVLTRGVVGTRCVPLLARPYLAATSKMDRTFTAKRRPPTPNSHPQ